MKLYLRLLSFLKPYRLLILAAFGCGAMVAGLTAVYTLLMQPLLDDIFIRRDKSMLLIIPPAIIALAFLKGLATYGQNYLWGIIGLKIVNDIREGLYRHLVLLPVGFHSRQATGALMTYILNDVNLIQSAVSTAIKSFIQQPLTLVALAGVILYQNFKLALLAIVVIPLFIVPLVRMGARLRKYAMAGQEKISALSAHLHETLAGIRIVKAFGKEQFESDRFKKKNQTYFRELKHALTIAEIATPLMETFSAVGVALLIWYAGFQVINQTMTAGSFFSFLTASMLMYAPLKTLGSANNMLQGALAAAHRIFDLWDQKNELDADPGRQEVTHVKGGLTFRDLSFTYAGAPVAALSHIDFAIKPGTMVAFIGHSGAGKSSLINLIPRFYEPTEGEIRLDGIPLSEIRLESLRRQIGIVSQEVVLFDETVGWNIGYGSANPSEEEIMKAAEAAFAHLFISKMQYGYETVIEKGGANLSGGERQRLAIARAILKNPPILILDEATSALDSESEFFVQKALANLMKDRTTLVIAHRLSTVLKADCIVVMEKGRIIEMGRHEELIQKDGHYNRVYQMQFGADGHNGPNGGDEQTSSVGQRRHSGNV
jgi:subfamily B ATP-binding cassette protein MsbA